MFNFVRNLFVSEHKPSYTWDGYFPHVDGFQNINGSKCTHKRRILGYMIAGECITSNAYAITCKHTDFRKRVSELRNEFGLNIQNIWVTPESGKRYKEYFFKTNEVVR